MKKIVVVLLLSILLTGCKKEEEIQVNVSPVEEEVSDKIEIIDLESTTRPIAVMINNHKDARVNHEGLDQAYIVYEFIVEGGITRLMALFKDKDINRVGPVRSSRHYFLDYALEHDSIYVHFGWSPQAASDIETLGVDNINFLYDSGSFRDRTLTGASGNTVALEHTAFANLSEVLKIAANKKYIRETTGENYNYSKEVILEGENSESINIPYSEGYVPSYKYDSESKTYLRFFNGAKHSDAKTKEQYGFKNLIIMHVKNETIDSVDRQDLHTVGTGEGYFFTNGKHIPITYKKDSRTAKTIFLDESGKEITLSDGNTMIQVVPITSIITIN